MMSLTFDRFTHASDSGPHGPLVLKVTVLRNYNDWDFGTKLELHVAGF